MYLGLFFAFISAVICSFLTLVRITFYRAKPLGSQTLYDEANINVLKTHAFYVWSFFVVSSIPAFVTNGLGSFLALLVARLYLTIVVNLALTLASDPIVRYGLIYHSTWVSDVDDTRVIKHLRILTFGASFLVSLLDYLMTENGNQDTFYMLAYGYGSDDLKKPGMYPVAKYAFLVILIPYVILQVRLEVTNFHFKEGFVVEIMARIKNFRGLQESTSNSHQDIELNTESSTPADQDTIEDSPAEGEENIFAVIRNQRAFIILMILIGLVMLMNFSVTFSVVDVQQLTIINVVNCMYFWFIFHSPQNRAFFASEFHFLIE